MGENYDDMADLNAFQDPAVIKASKQKHNPITYDGAYTQNPSYAYSNIGIGPTQTISGITSSRGFTDDYDARAMQLEREKAELEKRKLELDKREQEYEKTIRQTYKIPNFPPLPSFFPFNPCFYINIAEEIPETYTQICQRLMYRYYAYSVLLFVNIFLMLLGLISSLPQATVGLIMSIVAFVCIVPASFIFVFRSAYQALKSKSSFYFILFFVGMLCEIIFHFFQFLGITGNTWAGFINGGTLIDTNHKFVGALFIFAGFAWCVMFGGSIYLFRMMYACYRDAGGNIQDAQTEFASKVFYTSAQGAAQGAMHGGYMNTAAPYKTNIP